RTAGLGGVEISPIYAVEDASAKARSLSFLNPRWIELLGHTLREAEGLDLGVDMITGTGWPLGGPWVEARDAAARVLFETFTAAPRGRVENLIRSSADPEASLRALMAFSADGRVLDLTARVDASRKLDWTAP